MRDLHEEELGNVMKEELLRGSLQWFSGVAFGLEA